MSLATIFRSFFPILTIFQCFGLIYFDGKETQKKFCDSKLPPSLFVVYFVILVLALCGLSAFAVWVFLFKGKEHENIGEYVVDKFVVTAIFVGVFIAAYSTVIESFVTWKTHFTFFEYILEIDNFLVTIAPDTNIQKVHKHIYMKIVSTFLLIMFIHSVQIYIAFSTDHEPSMFDFWTSSFIPVLMMAITTCKYLFFLLMTQMRLKIASKMVEDIVDETEFSTEIIEVKEIKSTSLDISERVSTLRKGFWIFFSALD